ncbi:MAG: HAD family hydrolase [Clostridia bacterium]|nr:HAD family hydrolase [Clostridia bacterium]
MIKLAVFDMDGTICNTIDDLAAATNYTLSVLGYPLHTTDEYKYFVGNGIAKLLERSLPEGNSSAEEVKEAREIFLSYYKEHFADKTVAYDGIIPLLKALKMAGIHTAVCTNKAHEMAKVIDSKLFYDLFDIVIGQSDEYPLKPDPTSLFNIMKNFGAKPQETVFIGDSDVDMRTAKNGKAIPIGVTWGFRTADELNTNGAEHLAHTPSDILNIINNINDEV